MLNNRAGLEQKEGRIMLETGAEVLKNTTILHHPQEAQGGAGDWNGIAAVIALRRMLKALLDKIYN
jgi:hypothetical protein